MTKEDICKLASISMEDLDQYPSMDLAGPAIDSLPDGIDFHILNINNCPNLTSLPDNPKCTVLNITDCPKLERMPNNFQGDVLVIDNCPKLACLPALNGVIQLEIRHCPNLTQLPDGLELSFLCIDDSNIEALPEDCFFYQDLSLINCPYLKKLPDCCIAFSGDVNLYNCSLLSVLPDIKVVFGNLNIVGTSIKNLPKNIKIGGCLVANESKLETLPEGIRIGEYIDLGNCSNLLSLPDGLIVNGCLNLAGTPIKQLPVRLMVGGNLNILSTNIESLPDDLQVKGRICGSKRVLDTYKINDDIPNDLPFYVWKDSSYIYYSNRLYRIIASDQYSWRVIDAEVAVRIMLDMGLRYGYDIDDGVSYIVMDVDHHYGDGPTTNDALRRMEERRLIDITYMKKYKSIQL